MNSIQYIGEDVYGQNSFTGKKLLTKNKRYKLAFKWDGQSSLNGYWIFYIFDDLNDNDFRGYEVKITDIQPLRDSNLSMLLDPNI